jgi:hypothetical protein
MANKTPESIIFRFRPDCASLDHHLLKYIRSFRTANQMILKAVIPYWLPIAAKHQGFKKGNPLRQLAIESVIALYSRADQLCSMFGIDPADYGYCRVSFKSANASFEQLANTAILANNFIVSERDTDGNSSGNADPDGVSDEDEDLIELGITPRNFNLAGL